MRSHPLPKHKSEIERDNKIREFEYKDKIAIEVMKEFLNYNYNNGMKFDGDTIAEESYIVAEFMWNERQKRIEGK